MSKEIADQFSKETGIMSYFCETCKCWTIVCPECNVNFCSASCDCESTKLQDERLYRRMKNV